MRSPAKKQRARERRIERRDLVHAAGCVLPGCASKWFMKEPEWLSDPELAPVAGVKVPRSLRHVLGVLTGATP